MEIDTECMAHFYQFLQAHVVQFLGACIEPDCMTLVTELMDTSLDRIIHDSQHSFAWEEQ